MNEEKLKMQDEKLKEKRVYSSHRVVRGKL